MSLQKALCMICELPTADGAISAVQVDKDKLQTWFLNVCGHEMAEEVDDDDLICYFCLWHAEFQLKFDEMADENLVWWNLDLDLDDAARELRRNYFEGKLEQCWVQLEKIELPKSADGEERQIDEAEIQPRQWKCIYCRKKVKYARNLTRHMNGKHKEAIRWLLKEDIRGVTILHMAAQTADLQFCKFLVEKGADVHAKDFLGRSVLAYVPRKHKDKRIYFLSLGAGNGRDVKAVEPELLKAHVWPKLSHQNENRHTFILYPHISVAKTDNLIYLIQFLAALCKNQEVNKANPWPSRAEASSTQHKYFLLER
ncbi:Hypothetical predicted protein [Cloeon dipterum]|uniref:C2H2-type domain-containing protein n=1 Tax=Cloeon dipterum TaxID=197152 RepID=A0A8S1EE50_9INSE|nr:Hypothetical predicted protein [Cloeon dipterum]